MRDIAAQVAEARIAQQRVEVRAIDVHLSARVVHSGRDLDDLLLVHAVRGGVGDHESGEVVRVQGDLRAQVVEVDVAELVRRHDDDLHPREHGRGRVRAVSRRRDEAHRAVRVAVRVVIAADGEEAGQLTLRTGVRLQRDRVIPGDLGQPALELLDELEVALHVGGRSERGGYRRTPAS